MFTSVGFHKILPQHVDDYIENMKICAEKSNQEPGCIRYEVLQDADDPSIFSLYEVFEDEAAFNAWVGSEDFKAAHRNPLPKEAFSGESKMERHEVIITARGS